MSKKALFAVALALVGAGLFSAAAQVRLPAGGRIVRSLNAGWSFSQKAGQDLENLNTNNADWQKVALPHTWNDKDTFDEAAGYRRGPAWYARDLDLPANLYNKRLYLYFEGANQTAEVYVNTHLVGKHVGGYTAFCYDITDDITLGKPNEVAVRVDNSFNADIPPLTADFNMYGGIYRDVWLIAVDDLHFKADDLASPGVQISTPGLSADSGKVAVKGTISNTGRENKNANLTITVLDSTGKQVASATSTIQANAKADASFDVTTPAIVRPHLWSPDDPYLYSVRNTISVGGKVVDTVTQPLGFRWYRFDPDTGFYLNGKHLNLRGTNRHQDYKGLGNAVPDKLHVHDMELIKDAGFNFVRLAHYPQDPSVLQAADRLGLLIWEEIPIVNYITETQAFTDNSMTMLKEMVRQHRNHPSVILWGYMNEIYLRVPKGADSLYPATVELAKKLNASAHAEDPTRLTTIAFHGSDIYNKYGLGDVPDVVGWNIYKGWYGGELKEFGEYMDDQHRRFPKRVHLISEYGANGDQRLHSTSPRRFDSTTEYQRMFHESYLAQIDARPYIAASALWSEFDFGSELRGETIPHVNQKGMFSFDRTPKDVHFLYKAHLSSGPVVHIAVNDRKYFAGAPSAPQTIDVYSNLAEVELFCNGVSIGKKQPDAEKKASWQVPMRDGANELTARGSRKGKPVNYTARVNYKAVTAGSAEITINAGSNADFIDAQNNVWLADRPYQKGSWGFVGDKAKRIYSDTPDRDVLGTDSDPLFQTMVEGLTAYRFDVPDGEYQVELLFAESKFDEAGKRVFDVSINGNSVVRDLDLAKEAGRSRAVNKTFRVSAKSGIEIDFAARKGEPVISGIRLTKIPMSVIR
ncbi:MAG: glycoside hydrolase family 2 TIM barrel-domain containing protein [Acidobacteriota bacterium]